MKTGIRELPPSRRAKKQIVAHLQADLVEAVHKLRMEKGLTIQEIVGEAVNRAVAEYGRKPFLKVTRERLVKRQKALAQIQDPDKAPGSRAGKRRLAAWFDQKDVERVTQFKIEVGARIEQLVDMGLRLIISKEQIAKAAFDQEQKETT